VGKLPSLRRALLQPIKRASHELEQKLVAMLVVVALVMVVSGMVPREVVGAFVDVVIWRSCANILLVNLHSGSHFATLTHHGLPLLNLELQMP